MVPPILGNYHLYQTFHPPNPRPDTLKALSQAEFLVAWDQRHVLDTHEGTTRKLSTKS